MNNIPTIYKTLVTAAVFTVVVFAGSTDAKAQIFRSRNGPGMFQRLEIPSDGFINSPYNPTGRPLRGFQARWVARRNVWDARISQRTGRPVEQVAQRRIRRIEFLAAAASGIGQGLSSIDTTSSFGNSSYGSSTSGSRLASNTSLQLQRQSFNRNYSSNPDHRSVYGY